MNTEFAESDTLPVAVIGAGPVGLAAAAWLRTYGLPAIVLEAADVGAAVRQWGHVEMFTPWRHLVDAAAHKLLQDEGWAPPDPERCPTGEEWTERYLVPLAQIPSIAGLIQRGRRVVGVSRAGADKLADRSDRPFVLALEDGSGLRRVAARAVIDASGTWSSPNPLGAEGLPVPGERDASDRLSYRVPDLRAVGATRYAGRTTAVVGSGHSAQHTVLGLADLALRHPGTNVMWFLRREGPQAAAGGGEGDELPARAHLTQRAFELVASGAVDLVTRFRVDRVTQDGGQVFLHDGSRRAGPVDEVVVNTGFRPDLGLLRELRVDVDPAFESVRGLAGLIDPQVHSCATVPVHGAGELALPEPGLFVVGMKSYGRAPTFLARTGYEQVRSVVSWLARVPTTAPADSAASPSGATAAAACCGGPEPARC